MSRWHVSLSSEATKAMKKADRPTQVRLAQKIEALAADPFAASKPLVNSDMRSARVGGLRILVKIDHGEVVETLGRAIDKRFNGVDGGIAELRQDMKVLNENQLQTNSALNAIMNHLGIAKG